MITIENQPDEFDLARKVLLIQPQLPIILCTGFSATINEEKALAAGIEAFAMKPLQKDAIASLIRKVLS